MISNIQLGLGNSLQNTIGPQDSVYLPSTLPAALLVGLQDPAALYRCNQYWPPHEHFVDWLHLFLFSVPLIGESTKKLFFRPFEQIQCNGLYTAPIPQWMIVVQATNKSGVVLCHSQSQGFQSTGWIQIYSAHSTKVGLKRGGYPIFMAS